MKTVSELAEQAFVASERVKYLASLNIAHLDYDGRKKAAVEYAEAQAAEASAKRALDDAISKS